MESSDESPDDEAVEAIPEFNSNDPTIEEHFTTEELLSMSDYEKKRLRNIKRNFVVLSGMGEQTVHGVCRYVRFQQCISLLRAMFVQRFVFL